MNKTIIEEPMWPFHGGTITAIAAKESVVIDVGGLREDHRLVPWDKIDNMEWLAAYFRQMYVYQFEATCKALAKCVPLRDYYLSLPAEPVADVSGSMGEQG